MNSRKHTPGQIVKRLLQGETLVGEVTRPESGDRPVHGLLSGARPWSASGTFLKPLRPFDPQMDTHSQHLPVTSHRASQKADGTEDDGTHS